ncbi:unnamed protein product [Triticum turgidum subsp. durum]|uniref:Mitochondrial inner membrane protease ATP23 n=1 Tax=Triticum turgidum subsp. durum TaxID=4567 RepID=A0A9R1R9U2_TRITD|nr:unnamed protein product [Triticum turgidum subsp. durum]
MAAAAGDGGSVPQKTTRGEAPSASDPPVPRHIMPHEECVAGVRSALKDPTVRFLRERMEKAGCTVWPMLIRAATCASAGGYASREGLHILAPSAAYLQHSIRLPQRVDCNGKYCVVNEFVRVLSLGCFSSVEYDMNEDEDIALIRMMYMHKNKRPKHVIYVQIEVCCNHMEYPDQITQTITHELIHAYDDCVGKNMDWTNCAHHACSEIRANHLSGNCHYKRELMKGFLKIRGHEPECVKRRSLESVKNNPYCSETAAKDAGSMKCKLLRDFCVLSDELYEVQACGTVTQNLLPSLNVMVLPQSFSFENFTIVTVVPWKSGDVL